MSYEIKLAYGENTRELTLDNVANITLTDGVYFLYNSERKTLFTSPKEFVVYISKK